MIELDIIHLLIFFFIVVMQTIVGVGVLVLGTPFLLILQYEIVEVISILLPISIFTSLTNLLYFKFIDKISLLSLGGQIKKSFFIICLPAIFLGIVLLKNYHDVINFKILVSVIIFLTLAVKKYYKKNIFKLSSLKKNITLFFIGLVHGASNSGGTLLSIFMLHINKNFKDLIRYNLTYFYFYLALFQYLVFIIIFQKILILSSLTNLIFVVLAGTLFGNFLVKYIKNKKFNFLIEFLAIFSAIFLIIDN
jgi:uncharacterized membrane protein YfcA